MKSPLTYTIPSLSLNKYLIIVKPPEQILDRIKRLQKRWAETYEVKPFQLQSGYLLLCRFGMYAAMEERLLRKLHYAAMECAPYRIGIDGFFGLGEHSVGLKVANMAPVKQINRLIQMQLSGMKFAGDRPYYNHYPAIGLASRLSPIMFREIWRQSEHRHFNAAFTADHMMVLRKAPHTAHWSILDRFCFENLPIQSKQGVLFA